MYGRALIIWGLLWFAAPTLVAREVAVMLGVKLVASDRSGTLSWRLGDAATVKSPDKKLQDDLSTYLNLHSPAGTSLVRFSDAVASYFVPLATSLEKVPDVNLEAMAPLPTVAKEKLESTFEIKIRFRHMDLLTVDFKTVDSTDGDRRKRLPVSELLQDHTFGKEIDRKIEEWGGRFGYTLSYSANDLKAAANNGRQIAEEHVRSSLRNVAVEVIGKMIDAGIVPGSSYPDPTVLEGIIDPITGGNSPTPMVDNGADANEVRILFEGIQRPRKVVVSQEGDKPLDLSRYQKHFHTRNDGFFTKAAMDADQKFMENDRRLVSGESANFSDGEVTFTAKPVPRLIREVELSGSVKYGATDGLVVGLSGDFSDLTAAEDSQVFSFEAGADSFTAEGDVSWDIGNGFNPGKEGPVLGLSSAILEKGRYLLGGEERHELREANAGVHITFGSSREDFHRHEKDAYPFRRSVAGYSPRRSAVRLGVGWNRYDGVPDEGDAVVADLTYQLTTTSSGIDFEIEAGAAVAWTQFQGDDVIGKAWVSASARRLIRKHFIRGTLRGGVEAGDVPEVMQFRAGDDGFIRGLESGELIGREMAGVQLEAAYSLSDLFSKMTEKEPKEESKTSSGPAIFAVLSADAGWIGGEFAQSLGLGIEVDQSVEDRPVRFKLGYAWSPQSETSRGGLAYTEATLKF